MSGISWKTGNTASRLRGRYTRLVFCLMSYLDGWASLRWAWLANSRSDATTRSSPAQTGIECQLDMLRGGDKSYSCICDAAVIARPCAKGKRAVGEGKVQGRAMSTPASLALRGCGPLLAEQTQLMHLWALLYLTQLGHLERIDCRVISYTWRVCISPRSTPP